MPQPVAQIQIRRYKPGKGPLSGISYDEKSPLNQEKRLTGLCSAVQAQLRPSLTFPAAQQLAAYVILSSFLAISMHIAN